MSPRQMHVTRALALAILTTGLGACASLGRQHRESVQYSDQPVERLYNTASDYMDHHRWAEAVIAFQEVERQHPYSSWARRAILMEAYSHYMANEYDPAVEAAQRFISLHPGNESAPYAYYIIAICHFERILDIGRDQGTTERALAALNDVVRRFPTSSYARDARLKIDMVYDQLAGKEMEIGRFYLTRDQHLAAINRFRNVVENPNFQRTSHVPEALHRLVEAYLAVGMTDEAQRMAAILGYNFPGDPWYQRTYALLQQRNVQQVTTAEARRRGWLSRTFGAVF